MVLIQKQEQPDVLDRGSDTRAMALLALQLDLLQLFLPMDCWVVGRLDDANMRVVARLGGLEGVSPGKLDHLLNYQWAVASETDGFDYRALTENERTGLGALVETGSLPGFIRLIDLRWPSGRKIGSVLGLNSTALPLMEAQSGVAHTDEIGLCLEIIKATLGLQLELLAAQKLVVETRQDAQVDALTGLLNRSGWNERLVAAASGKGEIAICFADLDFLKRINDSNGHLAGDELLKLAAKTLLSTLRNNDCVARIGGDEFAIMVQGITTNEAHAMVERLKQALSAANIGMSIGLAFRSEGGSLQEAIALADARMYEDKNSRQRSCTAIRNDLTARLGSFDQ